MKPISDMLFDYSPLLSVTVASSGLVQRALSIRFDASSWFVLQGLSASIQTLNGTVQPLVHAGSIPRAHRFRTLFYTQTGTQFMNEAVEDEILFGSARMPAPVPGEFAIAPASTMFFDVTDMAGPSGVYPYTFQITLHGYRHFDVSRPPLVGTRDAQGRALNIPDQPYWYVGSGSITASSTLPIPVVVTEGSTFLLRQMYAYSTSLFSAQISDTFARQDWFQDYTNRENAFGNAEQPRTLRQPKKIPGNTTITVSARDLSAVANTVQVALAGTKRAG